MSMVPEELSSSVPTIEMEVSALEFDTLGRSNQRPFLGRFVSLKHFVLHVCNAIATASGELTNIHRLSILPADETFDFQIYTTAQLYGLTETLEHLEIVYQTDIDDSKDTPLIWSVLPANFKPFQQLRTLKVPHAFLTCKISAFEQRSKTFVADLLPSTLEEINVTHLDKWAHNVWSLLDSIAASRSTLVELSKVRLTPPGQVLQTFRAQREMADAK
jgi:hypothetical protein